VQLLFRGATEDRPDGLIIADDHLVANAASGLMTAGIRVPADVTVVNHANFPEPRSANLPFTRIGFDIRQLMLEAVDLITAARQGRRPAQPRRIGAIFEHDLPAETHDIVASGVQSPMSGMSMLR
jgi:DNA-binding LacI/PurR family transcriptional regulator